MKDTLDKGNNYLEFYTDVENGMRITSLYENANNFLKANLSNKASTSYETLLTECLNEPSKGNYINRPYFESMRKRIMYELSLELLYNVQVALEGSSSQEISNVDYAKMHKKHTGILSKVESIATSFPKKRAALLKEFNNYPYSLLNSGYKKYNFFSSTFNIEKVFDANYQNGIPSDDYLFYLNNHHRSIFHNPKGHLAITFSKYRNFLEDFLLHRHLPLSESNQNFKLDNEISAFFFEKCFYGISYSHFMMEFIINRPMDTTDFDVRHNDLCYAKLFDTHHPSLIDFFHGAEAEIHTYISDLFSVDRKNAYENYFAPNTVPIENGYLYEHFRLLNEFYLPVTRYMLSYILYEKYNHNLQEIAVVLEEQITNWCTDNEFYNTAGYCPRLLNINKKLSDMHTHLVNGTSDEKRKAKILFPSESNVKPEYRASHKLCQLFWENDFTNLLPTILCIDINENYFINPERTIKTIANILHDDYFIRSRETCYLQINPTAL